MDSLKRSRHAVHNLTYHIVLVTKYRHKCITAEIMEALIRFSGDVLAKMECSLIEANGENNHLHLLVEMPPKCAPAIVVNNLKTVTSRLIRKNFGEALKPYYWKPVFWEQSYFIITTGGASIETVKKYIQDQARP